MSTSLFMDQQIDISKIIKISISGPHPVQFENNITGTKCVFYISSQDSGAHDDNFALKNHRLLKS